MDELLRRRGLFGATPEELAQGLAAYQVPPPDYVGQVAQRVRALAGLANPSAWAEAMRRLPEDAAACLVLAP